MHPRIVREKEENAAEAESAQEEEKVVHAGPPAFESEAVYKSFVLVCVIFVVSQLFPLFVQKEPNAGNKEEGTSLK